MRNLVCVLAVIAVGFAVNFQANEVSRVLEYENPGPVKFDEDFEPSPWIVKDDATTLVVAQGQGPVIEYQDPRDSRIDELEAAIGELRKLASNDFETDKRIGELEQKMANAQSDIVDLGNGQADLTKRVEELTALIEVKTASGSIKTASVKLDSSGSGAILLSPGETLLSVDGVAVNTVRSSGGSSGTVSTFAPVYSSGGSSGTVSTSQVATYQTDNYSMTKASTASGPFVNVQRRTPLRTMLRPRASASTCIGPNCPK